MPDTAAAEKPKTILDLAEIEVELQRRLCDPARRTLVKETHFLTHLDRCVAPDGFGVSVQAGRTHYCSPRNNDGPWMAVELGFPTARVEAWMPFIDGADSSPTDTVYGYVPLDLVAQVFAEHGGLVCLPGKVLS